MISSLILYQDSQRKCDLSVNIDDIVLTIHIDPFSWDPDSLKTA